MKSFFRMSYPYILWIALFIVAPMLMNMSICVSVRGSRPRSRGVLSLFAIQLTPSFCALSGARPERMRFQKEVTAF